MNKNVLKAISLLKKVKGKARKGIGEHKSTTCPIHCAYNLTAAGYWGGLNRDDRDQLRAKGWTETIYDPFIQWYDDSIGLGSIGGTKRREKELRRLLK